MLTLMYIDIIYNTKVTYCDSMKMPLNFNIDHVFLFCLYECLLLSNFKENEVLYLFLCFFNSLNVCSVIIQKMARLILVNVFYLFEKAVYCDDWSHSI